MPSCSDVWTLKKSIANMNVNVFFLYLFCIVLYCKFLWLERNFINTKSSLINVVSLRVESSVLYFLGIKQKMSLGQGPFQDMW